MHALLKQSRVILKWKSQLFLRLTRYIYSKVPAFLNVVDIAGLVKGAAEGQGLGNSFLSHINACDGIFHLCRKLKRETFLFLEHDEACSIAWILSSLPFLLTQGRSTTTTSPTWRGTWIPWGISRSSARSCGWKTSSSWTAISRNWRNLSFEGTTRSWSPNTWVDSIS